MGEGSEGRVHAGADAVHHTLHFHAYYQERVGVFSLDPVELIAGDLPRAQRRLVEARAELCVVPHGELREP